MEGTFCSLMPNVCSSQWSCLEIWNQNIWWSILFFLKHGRKKWSIPHFVPILRHLTCCLGTQGTENPSCVEVFGWNPDFLRAFCGLIPSVWLLKMLFGHDARCTSGWTVRLTVAPPRPQHRRLNPTCRCQPGCKLNLERKGQYKSWEMGTVVWLSLIQYQCVWLYMHMSPCDQARKLLETLAEWWQNPIVFPFLIWLKLTRCARRHQVRRWLIKFYIRCWIGAGPPILRFPNEIKGSLCLSFELSFRKAHWYCEKCLIWICSNFPPSVNFT